MTTLYTHAASGAQLYKEIAQPHVERFDEVFDSWQARDVMKPGAPSPFQARQITGQAIATNLWNDVKATMRGDRRSRKHADYTMLVGPFCACSDLDRYFNVSCADWVLSRIRERTIIIPHERMSFEVTPHDNGWALVTAQHSTICGSVWLAYIKTDSIPRY